jgi:putative heme iron utilization protein
MSESFSPEVSDRVAEVSDRICEHMNQDHADAIVLYARAFGGVANANAAEMLKIDAQGMDLSVQDNGATISLHIAFDHTLADAEDAHRTLVDLVRQARQQLQAS